MEEAAWSPGSGRATSYDSLHVFLTSPKQRVNFTISTDSGLLTQEPGNAVKDFNWLIPNCISPGEYEVTPQPLTLIDRNWRLNLLLKVTLYENSHINGTPHFSITALAVEIENANPDGQVCASGLNDCQQDAVSSSTSNSPWLGDNPPLPNNPPGPSTTRSPFIPSTVTI